MVIFKEEKQDYLGSHRLVTVTSLQGKIMEDLRGNSINKELKGSSIINANQQGFMENKSCQTSLVSFLREVTSLKDESNCINVIYRRQRDIWLRKITH